MKILKKHISVGEYEFDVGINRELVADAFEAFPDLIEILLTNSGGNETDMILKAVKEKKLHQMLDANAQIEEFVKFCFPKMLEMVGDDSSPDEIIAYIYENEADEIFNSEMFKFICSGFTPDTAERKPKVKFKMK